MVQTMTKADREKIEAFETWIWRRMEKDQLDRQSNKRRSSPEGG